MVGDSAGGPKLADPKLAISRIFLDYVGMISSSYLHVYPHQLMSWEGSEEGEWAINPRFCENPHIVSDILAQIKTHNTVKQT